MKILAFVDYYLPGWKAGGPIRAVANLVERFPEHEFFIVTRDRDMDDPPPYISVRKGVWSEWKGCKVYYLRFPDPFSIARAIRGLNADVVWLNSYFSTFTFSFLILRLLALTQRETPLLLSPRGELAPNAMKFKRPKKRLYLWAMQWTRLQRGAHFHATAEQEARDIAASIKGAKIHFAPDLLPPAANAERTMNLVKSSGSLRLAFVSRVDHKKNLKFLLEVMEALQDQGDIRLDIYGPVSAHPYWAECEQIIRRLRPPSVQYHGPISHSRIADAMQNAHFVVLPTLDENFGYAIAEAWQFSRPVIISQQTPWRDLAVKNIGWDVPLDTGEWKRVLLHCLDLEETEWRKMCEDAAQYYEELASGPLNRSYTQEMLNSVTGSS